MKSATRKRAAVTILAILIICAGLACAYYLFLHQQKPFRTDRRVVYYGENGIFEYFPADGQIDRITGLPNDFYDRNRAEQGGKNIADHVSFSADGRYALCLKDFETTSMFYRTGSIFMIDLAAPEDRRTDIPVADHILDYDLISGDRLLYLNADGMLFLQDLPRGKKETDRQRVESGVLGYYLSRDKTRAFWYTSDGTGYAEDFSAGTGKKKVAGGISQIAFTSDDLNTIYYANADYDLLAVRNLAGTEIVDTDVADLAVIKATGHAYYLKKAAEAKAAETGAGNSTAADTAAGTGSAADTAAADGTADDAEADTETAGSLGYYDGTEHTILADGILSLDSLSASEVDHDRLLAEGGADLNYELYFVNGKNLLDTGYSLLEGKLISCCPDFSDDVLYYVVRDSADRGGSGSAEAEKNLKDVVGDSGLQVTDTSKGTLYSRTFADGAFTGDPVKVRENVGAIPAAKFGNVFTADLNLTDGTAEVSVNGKSIGKHAVSFYWDDTGKSRDVAVYCDVYDSSTYKSGRFVLVPEDGEPRDIAYSVSQCNLYKDETYTFLTDYDKTEGKGTLLYWSGTGDAVRVAENVTGTVTGDSTD